MSKQPGPILRQDPDAWKAGFAAGLVGDKNCPYLRPRSLSWAWSSGWIEGEAKRLKRDEG